MKEPTEQIGWTVIVLLAIAAIIANTLIPRVINDLEHPERGILAITLFMVFIAICGVLAMRYRGKNGSH